MLVVRKIIEPISPRTRHTMAIRAIGLESLLRLQPSYRRRQVNSAGVRMTTTLTTLLAVLMIGILGCSPNAEKQDRWISRSLTLNRIDSITVVAAALVQDGGTVEIYAITEGGKRCLIRQNQHAFCGDYPLNTINSPGRLIFNDQLIDVRSDNERKVLELLRDARFFPVEVEALGALVSTKPITGEQLHRLTSDRPDSSSTKIRDDLVQFVESERYLDVATSGLAPCYENGGQSAGPPSFETTANHNSKVAPATLPD